jgi:hypothetical protein
MESAAIEISMVEEWEEMQGDIEIFNYSHLSSYTQPS